MLHPDSRLTRSNQVTEMLRRSVARYIIAALLIFAVTGCEKRIGEAVVIGKDYFAATKEGEKVKDGRATNHEQWIVTVRMLDSGRRIDVRADQAQWEKLRENDRVKVNYRVGKYTGTVWDSEIE